MPGLDAGEQHIRVDVDEPHLGQGGLGGRGAGQPVENRVGHRADVSPGCLSTRQERVETWPDVEVAQRRLGNQHHVHVPAGIEHLGHQARALDDEGTSLMPLAAITGQPSQPTNPRVAP